MPCVSGMVLYIFITVSWGMSRFGNPVLVIGGERYRRSGKIVHGKGTWRCIKSDHGCKAFALTESNHVTAIENPHTNHKQRRVPNKTRKRRKNPFSAKIKINGISL